MPTFESLCNLRGKAGAHPKAELPPLTSPWDFVAVHTEWGSLRTLERGNGGTAGVTDMKCLLCLPLKSPLFGSNSCLACLEVIFLGGCTRRWGEGIQTAVLFWPLQPGDLVNLAYTAFLSSSTRRPFCEEDVSGALVRSVCACDGIHGGRSSLRIWKLSEACLLGIPEFCPQEGSKSSSLELLAGLA